MVHGPGKRVPFRRRREGKTDYRRRLRLLKGGLPRAVYRKTSKRTIVQIIEYDKIGDRVLVSAVSNELKKYDWKFGYGNTPAAYLTGYLAGVRAKNKDIKKAVLDVGLHKPVKGAKCFAVLKGLIDAGMDIPHGDDDIFPSKDRIYGKHINPGIEKYVEDMKKKIEGGEA